MLASTETFDFGPFRLQPERRLLLADGVPVSINARAFDILEFLIRNRERVVRRDEIVDYVWRGMTVGENNLSVQMSALRRALASPAGAATMIVNVPGRGYRFVADVTAGLQTPQATRPPDRLVDQPLPNEKSFCPTQPLYRIRRRLEALRSRRPLIVMTVISSLLTLVVGVGVATKMHSPSANRPPLDDRLTMIVEPFTSDAGDQEASNLARLYSELLVKALRTFEDFRVYADSRQVPAGLIPHFRLDGSIHLQNGRATILLTATEQAAGFESITPDAVTADVKAPFALHSARAFDLTDGVRQWIYDREQARRRSDPADAFDALIAAHVRKRDPSQLAHALALAKVAYEKNKGSRPARALLAIDLTKSMMWSPNSAGDVQGEEARKLIDNVVNEEPDNILYISIRAYNLAVLGLLGAAEQTAKLGLVKEPFDYVLNQTLGEVYLQQDLLDDAHAKFTKDPRHPHDDRLSYLNFAAEHYADALTEAQKALDGNPSNFETPFTMLVAVSALAHLNRLGEAKTLLSDALHRPGMFQNISELRRNFFALSESVWQRLISGLAKAGMAQ